MHISRRKKISRMIRGKRCERHIVALFTSPTSLRVGIVGLRPGLVLNVSCRQTYRSGLTGILRFRGGA
jgi:hypothetical protein